MLCHQSPKLCSAVARIWVAALLCSLLAFERAGAATLTWTGLAGDNNVSTAGNWSPAQSPTTNDLLIFAGSTGLAPQRSTALTLGSITFNSTAGAFTLGGAGIYTISTAAGVTNNSTTTETINNAISLGIAQTWSATSGSLVFGGNIANGGFLLTIGGGSNTSASGVISGTGGLTKTGAGTLTLSGANTYSGTTTITAGTLQLGDGTTGNDGTIANSLSVVDNSALVFNRFGNISYAGVISGTGTLTKLGAGTQTLTGANTYSGATTITTGTLQLGDGTSGHDGTIANSLSVVDNSALIYNRFGNASYAGVISGTGTVTKLGAGTQTLTGANTYSGGTILNAGTLSISSDGNLGAASGGITFGGGTLASTQNIVGTRAINMAGAGVFSEGFGLNLEQSGAVSGNGNITVTGNGTLILSGSGSNGTGTTTLTSGDLSLRGTVSLGSGVLTFQGGVLELGNSNFTRALGTGAGQVNMSSASGGAGFSAYGADRIVNLGGSGATVTWGSGNFVASGQPLYIGTPTADHVLDFQNPINLNGATRTITVTGGTGTGADGKISGVISGTGASNLVINSVGFAPWNPGTLILSAANTYVGTTTISNGVLNIQNSSALGTTAAGTTVSSGAALQIQGGIAVGAETLTLKGGGIASDGALRNISDNNSWSGNLTLGSASTIASDAGTLTLSGTLTNGGFGLTFGGAGDVVENGVISGTGGLTKNGTGTLTLSVANNFSGVATINSGTIAVVASALGSNASTTINAGTLEITTGFSTTRSFTLGSVASTFQVDPSQTYTVTTAIGGTGSLTKTGAGTMVLGATETYSGSTTVSAGTLQINASERIPNGSALTVSGGTFDLQTFSETVAGVTLSSGSITGTGAGTLTGSSYAVQSGTISAILAGAGALTKSTSGTVTLSGANTYTGGSTINGGTLIVNSPASLGATSGSLTINAGTLEVSSGFSTSRVITLGDAASTFQIDPSQTYTVTSAIGGTGSLTKNGTGTMVLGTADTYSGSTTISAGTLQVNANNALGTTAGGTTVSNGAALNLNGVNYSSAEALTLSGSGISGAGALTNSGTSTYAGAINIGTNATISASGGILTLTGGIVKNGTTLTFAGGGTVNVSTNGITGSSANSDLVVDGSTVVLSAANSYNGPTSVQNSGTLKLGASNVLPTSPQTALSVNTSGVFDLASYGDGVASLAGDSSAMAKNSVASTTSALTMNPATGVSTTFAGVIAGTSGGTQGNIALTKTGAGTVILTGANTFSGTTTISGGTLNAAATSGSALASTSAIIVNSGGTLLLGADNQINNAATMSLGGGTFGKGNFNEGLANNSGGSTLGLGALTLTATGSHLDFGAGTVGTLSFASFTPGSFALTIDNWTGTANLVGSASTDRLIFNSDQVLNLTSFSFSGYSLGAVELSLGGGFYEVVPVTPVPEPATCVAAVLTLAALGYHQRFRLLHALGKSRPLPIDHGKSNSR